MQKLSKIISKNLSLRLSLVVVLLIALLLSGSLAVMFYFSRQAMREEATKNAEMTLDGTAQHVDNILLSVEQSAGNVYWDLLSHLNQPDRMNTYCRTVVECNPYIVGCAIVFKPYYYPGRELFMAYVHRKGNSVMTDERSEFVTQETFTNRPYTEQVWYTEPMKAGRALWTDPLKNEETEDKALISFCLPIYDRSMECVGVLAVDLSIGLLSQVVLATKSSANGYCTLMARNGSFIVHPDSVKLTYQTVFVQMEQGADHSVLEAAEAMVSGETGEKPFLMNGRRWYLFYKPFVRAEVPGRAMENLGWSIGLVYPEDDIFGNTNRLFYYLLAIAVVGLLLLFVLCRFITHLQLLPLNMLTHYTRRIAEGNYNEAIPDTSRMDEIGQLQEHFQNMQKSLAVYIGEQEQMAAMIQERSKVLQSSYKRAQEADRMKTSFLHLMTNQMMGPSEAIKTNVTALCDNYQGISLQEAEREVAVIKGQGEAIIDLLNHMLHSAEKEEGERSKEEGERRLRNEKD